MRTVSALSRYCFVRAVAPLPGISRIRLSSASCAVRRSCFCGGERPASRGRRRQFAESATDPPKTSADTAALRVITRPPGPAGSVAAVIGLVIVVVVDAETQNLP